MKTRNGFTLLELMIVCAIISLLAAISIVRFVQLIDIARESVTKANLCSLRAAIASYYCDTKGLYPVALDNVARIDSNEVLPVFIPRYMQNIPSANLRRNVPHNHSNAVATITTGDQEIATTTVEDVGGWIYSSSSGDIRISCTCKDSASLDKIDGIRYFNYGHEE
ncbi:MAG: type II secretion system protein [Candidatus Desantisbacteria bacterium]